MTASKEWRVAVVGATGLVGEALLDVLGARRFPVGQLHALASNRSLGTDVEFRGESLPVDDLDGFDFAGVELALFAAGADVARLHVPRALAAGCTVVDASAAFRGDPDVPLVVPGVNDAALAKLAAGPRLVAGPGGATVALCLALKPLHEAVGVERINLVSLESVSGAGRDAVEELAGQCAQLLNGRPAAASRTLPAPIAFNCIPLVGGLDEAGVSAEEHGLASETQKIMGDPTIKVNATAVRVPVFFGDCLAVHAEFRGRLDARRAAELLGGAHGLLLADGVPTPALLADDRDVVWVGRLRDDPTSDRGIDLWLVADNVRRGSAFNTVEIVEVLVRDYF